ncbi:MAG: shikimate kinase [Treponema sp.]|jgi:shikimate kinase|nr:shikimate kinase [Treponema sp.]
MEEKIILLLGPKHSGKTSAARALAESLRCRCVDLDALIETRTGKKPRALYREGVEAFRRAEAEALADAMSDAARESLATDPRASASRNAGGGEDVRYTIISTGGGLIDNGGVVSVVKALKPQGNSERSVILVFLEVSAKTAWNRICRSVKAGGELPPFLQTETPEETHRLLHERRNRAYKELANFTVMAEHKTEKGIAAEILQRGGVFADKTQNI